jgi:hypothetical protein
MASKMKHDEIKQFLAIRKEEGRKIDPETAEVTGWWGDELDPYWIHDCPLDERCSVPVQFARSPGSDIWVSFCDLPRTTVERLRARPEDPESEARQEAFNSEIPF